MKYKPKWPHLLFGLLLLSTVALVACAQEPETVEVTRLVTVEAPAVVEQVVVTRLVEVPATSEDPGGVAELPVSMTGDLVVPYMAQWSASPHADSSATAFNYWNNADPAEIPIRCAKCHSTPGFLDFLGADGSTAGMVDAAAPLGSTVTCEACHNEVTAHLDSATFPSGVEVTGLGPEARCIQCHQGRASTVQVNESIANAGLGDGDEDAISEDLGFTNIHYYAAAATQYGTVTKGGYEYPGKAYDARFDHVEPYSTCVDCHNPHTLEVQFDECAVCHTNLRQASDLVNIRMAGSLVDYDGDGDMNEGVYYEIEGLREMLYQAMQAYAVEVTEKGIVYDSHSHPYFFIDSNGNGVADDDEVAGSNRFNAWTPRLAKAAYNFQVSLKDTGRYAHGGKYIIQLLYDSIEDLNTALTEPVDLSRARRIDHGHFAGSEQAFRNWDAQGGIVPATCSRCHTAVGLPFFAAEGVAISQPASSGLNCATCHNDVSTFTLYEFTEVTFPSGARLSNADQDIESNLCLVCHQGRESTVSVNRLIGGLADDQVSENLRFLNIHYFAAGATLFGTEAKGAYEYAGQTYVGRNVHIGAFDTCNECHDTHSLEVKISQCAECHEGAVSMETLSTIRISNLDHDGNGTTTEGIAVEIAAMKGMLYEAMQAYATQTIGTGIVYSSARHPYFFNDSNSNGVADPDEINAANRFNNWTPRLLRAAYNFQYVSKDPGAFAHNSNYILQILYDSLVDIGADTTGMMRPPT